jgi:hypothetical protein
VSTFQVGTVLAVVVAGWPLYTLVQSGSMGGDTALARGVVVAAGCAVGVAALRRLAVGYEQEAERSRLTAEAEAGRVHEGRVQDGRVQDGS